MEFGIIETLVILGALFLAVYYYCTSTYNFWRNRNVAGPKPAVPFGNFKDIMLSKLSLHDYIFKEYQKFKDEPMFGIFARRTPILVVKDADFIKDILIKDFSLFSDRAFTINEKVEPLSQHLFGLETARWRPLRTRLSPVFTSGKLKEMFYLLMDCADHFEDFLKKCTSKNPVIECRDLTAKYTTDVIGVCAFGLKMNALGEEESDFRKIGRKIFETTLWKDIRNKIRTSAPWLYNLLAPIFYDYELNNFFIGTMKETIKYRKENNIKRNDFVDLLMEIQDNPNKVGDIEMTDVLVTAQAFVFFIAGFETSSTTMSNALYELAQNHSVQNKLREEIMEELEKNDGALKYESIKNMKYMDKVFSETLRKYPPLATIMRKSMEKYTFAGTNITIPKGTSIWIPAYSIQRDPDIYPEPDTFDPERFDEDAIKQRHSSFYLPFGDGPRNCIGARFAHYQTKVGLVKVLKNFKVDVCSETIIPLKSNPRAFIFQPLGGITLKFTKIE